MGAPALFPALAVAAGDERTGLAILKRALEMPARQIAENSSVDLTEAVMTEAAASHLE